MHQPSIFSVQPVLSPDQLTQQDVVSQWCDALGQALANQKSDAVQRRIELALDLERGFFLPEVHQLIHGVPTVTRFGHEFFASMEYEAMAGLGKRLAGLLESGAYVMRDGKSCEINSLKEGIDWLMAESRRRYYIQRYKGLGEMNPDQLWETTINPETRRLLRVTVEDAIAADQMFNTLMGDNVEPRREFIEENALAVVNLDI